MTNLLFNPEAKDFYKSKACVAISMRYNYAGSYRSYRFKYLSFRTWSSSYRAAFCYVLKRLDNAVLKDASQILSTFDICTLFIEQGRWFNFLSYFGKFSFPRSILFFNSYTAAEKLSFTYKLLDILIQYNLGEVRYNLVSSQFETKSAIRYAASKYFPDTSFIDIESDSVFKECIKD